MFKKVRGGDLLTGRTGSCTNTYICSRCRAWAYLLDREAPDLGYITKISTRYNHRNRSSGLRKNRNERPADDRSPMEKNT